MRQFIGQEESLRLEFKAGALFEQEEARWVAELSKQVSAFANTEGGTLVLGLPEERVGKRRIACDPDGIAETLGRDQLQRKVEGNVFPYLPGIRVHRVPIASLTGRVVFILEIPQGSTAYQANDGRYYGRSELECKYLPDHEIRVRMARGRVARASVVFPLSHLRVTMGSVLRSSLREKYAEAIDALATNAEEAVRTYPKAVAELMDASIVPDTVEVEPLLRNDGELTIRDPSVELSEGVASDSFGFLSRSGRVVRHNMEGEVIYPGDERVIPNSRRSIRCKRDQPIAANYYICEWRVFLDNAPPSSGQIDLGTILQTARESAAALAAAAEGA